MTLDIDEIRNLPRSEQVFLNIATHLCLFPSTLIREIQVTAYERVYAVRVNYASLKTAKQFYHVFNFYRNGEEHEALRLLKLLSSHYPAFSVTGYTIEI